MAKRKCRYGKLKNQKGRRICRRKPRRGKSGSSGRCRYGKLKNPKGKRRCKKRPFRPGRGGAATIRAQEAAMWKAHLGRFGRRLRRR